MIRANPAGARRRELATGRRLPVDYRLFLRPALRRPAPMRAVDRPRDDAGRHGGSQPNGDFEQPMPEAPNKRKPRAGRTAPAAARPPRRPPESTGAAQARQGRPAMTRRSSSPSSAACRTRWPPGWGCRRSTTWSATSCARCLRPATWASAGVDDEGRQWSNFRYEYEHGVRIRARRRCPCAMYGRADRETESARARRLRYQNRRRGDGRRHRIPGSDMQPGVRAGVPIFVGDRACGADRAGDYEREHAYGENEVRLLEHRGGQHGRRAGERAPVRRDAAPAEGDRAARPPSWR